MRHWILLHWSWSFYCSFCFYFIYLFIFWIFKWTKHFNVSQWFL